MRIRAHVLFCVVLFSAALAGAAHHEEGESAAAAGPPTKPWNQEEMTRLTGTLSAQMGEVRQAYRQNPLYRDPVASNQRAANELGDTLQQLDRSCRQLASQVKGGGDRAATEPVARRIGTLLRDADVSAKRLMTTQWTEQRVRPAMETLNAIAPYYGSGPLYDTDTGTMQRGSQ